jgi:hypothetical protein
LFGEELKAAEKEFGGANVGSTEATEGDGIPNDDDDVD